MIEVIDYKPFKPKDGTVSHLKGFCKIRITTPWGKLTCADLQIFSKQGKHWVNFPSKRVEDDEGVKHFAYCRFEDREESDKFSENVINALKTWKKLEQGNGTAHPSMPQPSEDKGPSKAIRVISMDPVLGIKEEIPF